MDGINPSLPALASAWQGLCRPCQAPWEWHNGHVSLGTGWRAWVTQMTQASSVPLMLNMCFVLFQRQDLLRQFHFRDVDSYHGQLHC